MPIVTSKDPALNFINQTHLKQKGLAIANPN